MTATRRLPRGFTLLELLVVVGILVAMAAIVLPKVDNTVAEAQAAATRTTLNAVRDAIRGTADNPGFINDMGRAPESLDDLLRNPVSASDPEYADSLYNVTTHKGWRGPYLEFAGTSICDAWGTPIVLQSDAADPSGRTQRLISCGNDKILNTLPTDPDVPVNADDILVMVAKDGAKW